MVATAAVAAVVTAAAVDTVAAAAAAVATAAVAAAAEHHFEGFAGRLELALLGAHEPGHPVHAAEFVQHGAADSRHAVGFELHAAVEVEGVDMVLGDEGDFAIEINPRLTTSYVGLRSATDVNLAEAMVRIAEGGTISDVVWKPGRVRW